MSQNALKHSSPIPAAAPADITIGNHADAASPPPSSPKRSIAFSPIDALVSDDPAMLRDVVRQLLAIIEKQQHDHDALRHQFDQLKRRLFGPKSERSDPNQLLLFPEMHADDAASNASPAAETTHPLFAETPDAAGSARSDAATRKSHGRKGLNPNLRREERAHNLPESERRCPTCKVDCILFGEDVREQPDYVPASLFVVRHVCRKYACPKCHDSVAGASRPESPIERGLPGPGLLGLSFPALWSQLWAGIAELPSERRLFLAPAIGRWRPSLGPPRSPP